MLRPVFEVVWLVLRPVLQVPGAVFEVVRPVLRPVFEVLGAVFEYRVRRKISVSRRLLSQVSTWRARQSVRCQQI